MTSMEVPTSIFAATGTPIVPVSGTTITSYKIVPPSNTFAAIATATPTKANAGAMERVSMWDITVAVLGISGVLLA